MEKTRFKAGGYQTEINKREEELAKMRQQVMSNADELKTLTVQKEQFKQQKDLYSNQIDELQKEIQRLTAKADEQDRVISTLCLAQKDQSFGAAAENMERVKEDQSRIERLAKANNKSGLSFVSAESV